MRDATRPSLLVDVAAETLHDRGLLTLTETLNAGRLLTAADHDELVACAKLVGGVWLGPAIATSAGRTAADTLGDYFGERLAQDLLITDPDSVPERELRDLEWAYALMSDNTTALRFVETLPPDVRRVAERSAARAWLYGGEAVLETVRDLAWDRSRFSSAS
jgi:hypothetical protein